MSKLTVKGLESLRDKDQGNKLREDGGLIGTVRARSNGVSVYFDWRYRFAGKVRQISVGSWPSSSMPDIRKKRDWLYTILKEGKDPAEEKRIERLKKQSDQAEASDQEQARIVEAAALKARMSISELFNSWEKRELKERKDQGAEVRRSFAKDVFPAFGHLTAETVTRSMVVAVLDNVVERGARIIARNLLGDIRQMFGYAILRGIVENDPTYRLKRDDFGKKVERDRILSDAEIKALPDMLSTACLGESSTGAIWIMLSTCCRVGEISRAKWNDIDLVAGTWRIPPENAKNAKAHTIYLSAFAVRYFEALKIQSGESPWVLSARWTDKHICVKSLAKQISDRQRGERPAMTSRSKNINALELKGGKWTPHDLRRTGATMMGVLGVRPDVIEKCLNHVEQNKIVRVYQRQKLETEQAEAWRQLGDCLERMLCNDSDKVAQ